MDDDPAICKFVDRVLREAGHGTKIAFNASMALAMIETFGSFDVLVTDVSMPNVPGNELAAEARRIDPDIRILYLTGYSDLLFREKRMLWEGEAYLDKPVTGKALLEAITGLVS